MKSDKGLGIPSCAARSPPQAAGKGDLPGGEGLHLQATALNSAGGVSARLQSSPCKAPKGHMGLNPRHRNGDLNINTSRVRNTRVPGLRSRSQEPGKPVGGGGSASRTLLSPLGWAGGGDPARELPTEATRRKSHPSKERRRKAAPVKLGLTRPIGRGLKISGLLFFFGKKANPVHQPVGDSGWKLIALTRKF